MPDLDIPIQFPRFASGLPVSGDNVIYSTRPFVSLTSGRPREVGPLVSGEIAMRSAHGWFQADTDAVFKVQGWDLISKAWVTVNGNGSGTSAPAAGGPFNFDVDLPGGDVQLVVNFPIAPAAWKAPSSIRLGQSRSF